MVQLIECLPCKLKDLSSLPKTDTKSQECQHLERQCWGGGDSRSPGFRFLNDLRELVISRLSERHCLK